MSAVAGAAEQQPSYDDAADAGGGADDMVQPAILVLAGQSIHAETADSAPLYQLNRGIASLTQATREVEFERVEHTVRTGPDGGPAIRPRPRHLYMLHHPNGAPGSLEQLPSDSPRYYARSVSRRTAGDFGIRKSRLRARWKALPVDVSGKKSDRGLPQFVQDAAPLFEIQHKNGRYEWTDGEGKAVALEDEGEDQHRLIITAEMSRKMVDVLVALWCCRIWQYSADHSERIHEGMEGGEFPKLKRPFLYTSVVAKIEQ